MATEVEICNLALSRLGDRATLSSIDPPEGSAQADHCAQWWPIARDVALESHDWNFTIVRAAPPALEISVDGWLYSYPKPNDALKVIKVILPEQVDWRLAEPLEFGIEAEELTAMEIIVTNYPDIVLVYQQRVRDAQRYPPTFASALAWLVASYLAGSIIKGDAGRKASQNAYAAWQLEMARAAKLDANQKHKVSNYVPEAMRARGYASSYQVPDAPVIGPFGWYAYPSAVGPNNG